MPLAKKFRAMLDFPFPSDMVGEFTVDNVDVRVEREDREGIVYRTRLELSGPGSLAALQKALKPFFAQHPTTFSGYGNPYLLWFGNIEYESLGEGRFAVNAKGLGVRVYLAPELGRFLEFLATNGHLAAATDSDAQATLVAAYLAQYQKEIARLVGRYTRKVERTTGGTQQND